MRQVVAVAAILMVVLPSLVEAQETTGAIIGTITSQDGEPLVGVTVTIEDLDRGFVLSAVSGAAGAYRFLALSPARYEVTAGLKGYQTVKRTVDVVLGRTTVSDVEMMKGAVTDTIEVTGEAPLVDVTSTVSGLTVNTDELNDRIPVGREATQIALLAPTTVSSDTYYDGYVGFTPGQNVVSIGGASAAENLYQVNGLNITNVRDLIGSSFVPFEFLDEVQVTTGGYEAEFGRSIGGVINMVTKTGTNTLRGGVDLYLRPESLQEQEPDAWVRQNQNEFSKGFEANASLGGAFVRDKLFFFAFVRYVDSELSEIVGARETVFTNNAPYYGAKLDWNITQNHRVEGTYLNDRTDLDNDAFFWDTEDRVRGGYLGTGINRRGGDNWILKYSGVLADNLLLGAQYGVNRSDRSNNSTADDCPYALDARGPALTPVGCWVNVYTFNGDDERTAYRVDVDWFVGGHSLRAGFDNEDLTSTEQRIYSGGKRYLYLFSFDYPEIGPNADVVEIRTRESGGTFDTTSTGVYAQDSWAISSAFTLNFGVRWEKYENFNTAGDAFITIDDQYAPRVGFIWDPSKQGRRKVFGSFGQYHIPIASNTNIRLASTSFDVFEYYEVTGQGADGLPYDPATGEPTGLGQLLEVIPISSGEVPDTSTLVASNLDPMSQWEYILGYEQMVGADWSLGARFVMRQYDQVIENFTIDQGLAEQYGAEGAFFVYVLGNPGSDFEGFYDLDRDGVNDPISLTAEELGYPEPQRDYYAVEFTANRRFSNNWLLQASYVWSQVYGNHEGYLRSDFGENDPGFTTNFDFPSLMDNSYGFLPNDRRHNLKVFGSYAFDMGLQIGGFAQWRTGRPINAFAVHPDDFWAGLYGNSSFFEQVTPGSEGSIPSPRGSQGTTDDVTALDAMLRYDFGGGRVRFNVRMDVFNLFNQQNNIEVHEFSGTRSFAVDAGFLETTHYQPPRSVRFGFGLTF